MQHKILALLLAAGLAGAAHAADQDAVNAGVFGQRTNLSADEQQACAHQMVRGNWTSPDRRGTPPAYECAVAYWTWKTKGMLKQGFQAPAREDYQDWLQELASANNALAKAEAALKQVRSDGAMTGADTFEQGDIEAACEKARAAYIDVIKRDPMASSMR